MGPKLFAILMIANFLACPLRCLSLRLEVVVEDECAEPACCCCSDAKDVEGASGDEHVPVDDRDRSCPNCICEGATIQDGIEICSPAPSNVLRLWINRLDDSRPARTTSMRMAASDRPLRFSGGRDALVAYQSWLI